MSDDNYCVGCAHCTCDPSQMFDVCIECEDCCTCTCPPGLRDDDCPEHGGQP